jgi:hypothetical protein
MGLNVVNEKTTTQMLDFVANKVQQEYGISFNGYSFYGDTDEAGALPRYAFMCDTA